MGLGIHPIFAVRTYIGLAISQLSCTVLSYYGTEIALRNRPDAGRTALEGRTEGREERAIRLEMEGTLSHALKFS